MVLPQVQGLAVACCHQGIRPQLEMWRGSNSEAEQQVRARDELRRERQGSQSGTRSRERGMGTGALRVVGNRAMYSRAGRCRDREKTGRCWARSCS